ncbi:hypothetical protein BDY21DRAFT_372694 [Lineolata rhizophorae]|uniref:Uncharacterized protein n=1 Tax=Lineolata rhizophorae TaxID=578093 RepID=A0A6A6NX60_9PEZI|nr:hypothetical protein BDY21DRAFT_372694 [Lineolata rhizophorae]
MTATVAMAGLRASPTPRRALNKKRVYIALYGRGTNKTSSEPYHWAIIVGPKKEVENGQGVRYHARQIFDATRPGKTSWAFERREIALAPTSLLLARVLVAKVADDAQLGRTLGAVAVVQNDQDPAWNCKSWIRTALAALEGDGRSLGTRVTDWRTVEGVASAYVCCKKRQRRFDTPGAFAAGTVPTFDLLAGREIIS